LVVASLVVLALTFVVHGPPEGGHYVRPVTIRWLAVAAAILSAVPLVRVPFAITQFNAAMQSAIGDEWLRNLPADRRARMRPTPVSAVDLFRGIRVGDARVTRHIPFATPQGIKLTLDVYRPPDPKPEGGPHPVIVQIYGGAWQRGAPGDDARFATYLAARGFAVFAIDYRHAPQWRWPAQIEDVREALRWIRAHAEEYDADPTRLALVGRSAGAQLAMVAGYEPDAPPIAAVVSYYGPIDLADGYRNPPAPDPIDVRAVEEAFLGGTPDAQPARYREASPITYAVRPLPPTLLMYGRRDHVVLSRFGATLDARLRSTRTTSVFLEIPWAEHAFDIVTNGPSGQMSLYYAERFLTWAVATPLRRTSTP
jgi:acetyl esterase/lipase